MGARFIFHIISLSQSNSPCDSRLLFLPSLALLINLWLMRTFLQSSGNEYSIMDHITVPTHFFFTWLTTFSDVLELWDIHEPWDCSPFSASTDFASTLLLRTVTGCLFAQMLPALTHLHRITGTCDKPRCTRPVLPTGKKSRGLGDPWIATGCANNWEAAPASQSCRKVYSSPSHTPQLFLSFSLSLLDGCTCAKAERVKLTVISRHPECVSLQKG